MLRQRPAVSVKQRFGRALLLSLLMVTGWCCTNKVRAQSFPCNAAQSSREKTVCAWPPLAALDSQLAAAYKALRASLSPEAGVAVQADQRAWLRWLEEVCPAHTTSALGQTDCLLQQYQLRLDVLTKGARQVGALHFYPRTLFRFVPANPAENPPDKRDDNDPGFGYGTFSYPQLDRPTAAESQWNTYMKQRAAAIDTTLNTKTSPQPDWTIHSDGSWEGTYRVYAANPRLVVVDMTLQTYSWGAAHPLTDTSAVSWWLQEARPLRLEDIFAHGAQGAPSLFSPAVKKLQGEGALLDPEQHNDQFRTAVIDGLRSLGSIDISAKGLAVTYGQYAVGPYAGGMPQIEFTWNELRPLLNPALDPATLPPPLR